MPAATPGGRTFDCKPRACPAGIRVNFSFGKTPSGIPTPQLLEHIAKVELPKNLRGMINAFQVRPEGNMTLETLSATTGALKNYPAVFNETKMVTGRLTAFFQTTQVFAGGFMINVIASSSDRDLARKSMTQFLDSVQIAGKAPLPSSPPPERKPAQSL